MENRKKCFRRIEILLLVGYILILIGLVIFFAFSSSKKQLVEFLQTINTFSVKWFFGLWGLGTVLIPLGFPISFLDIAYAALLQNIFLAYIICYLCAITGSIISFLAARYLFQKRFLIYFEENRYFIIFGFLIQKDEFKFTFLFQFIPLIHVIKTTALGITKVRFTIFLLTLSLAALIYTTSGVYLGSTLKGLYQIISDKKPSFTFLIVNIIVYSISLVLSIYLVKYSISTYKKYEEERLEGENLELREYNE